jgi:hypothetical protein
MHEVRCAVLYPWLAQKQELRSESEASCPWQQRWSVWAIIYRYIVLYPKRAPSVDRPLTLGACSLAGSVIEVMLCS